MRRNLQVICPHCRANSTAGEWCECQQIDFQPELITETDRASVARAVVTAMKRVIDPKTGNFKDPELAAEFEVWLAKRNGGRVKEVALCSP